MMELRARLRAAIDAKGLTQADVAEAADMPEETISRILTGATQEPGVFTIARIAHAIGETVGSLLGEKGFDLTAADQQYFREFLEWGSAKLAAAPPPQVDALAKPNVTQVQVLMVADSQRPPRGRGDVTEIPWHFRDAKASMVFRARGDSMTPVIADRDLLFVREAGELRDEVGKLVVCRLRGKELVKKLELSRGRVRLLSTNPRYATIEADRADVELVGVVVGRSGEPAI
jgi:SOS-response transcriptional repressor LexA